MGQKICSPKCAIAYVKLNNIKKFAQKTRVMRKESQSSDKSYQTKLAQTAFNRYIRLRDDREPCISCGRYHTGQYHAGHYRSVGAHPELRFELNNCHKQCSGCNNHKSGNILEYRINLLLNIWSEKLKWLEGHHELKKYSIDDLKAITKIYKDKIKLLSLSM
jgi:hypothetical protein